MFLFLSVWPFWHSVFRFSCYRGCNCVLVYLETMKPYNFFVFDLVKKSLLQVLLKTILLKWILLNYCNSCKPLGKKLLTSNVSINESTDIFQTSRLWWAIETCSINLCFGKLFFSPTRGSSVTLLVGNFKIQKPQQKHIF